MEKKVELIEEVKDLFEDWRPTEEKKNSDQETGISTQTKISREINRLEYMHEVLAIDLERMQDAELLSRQLTAVKDENEELYNKLLQRSRVSDSIVMSFLDRIWSCQN